VGKTKLHVAHGRERRPLFIGEKTGARLELGNEISDLLEYGGESLRVAQQVVG